jgi:hypothetical protein
VISSAAFRLKGDLKAKERRFANNTFSLTKTAGCFNSITFFHNTLHRRHRVKTMLHCLGQFSVFVREDLGKVGNPQNH